ncbi:hypothetical protein LSCM1_05624 [Leishmania martiniquensis]|uniref:Uncharacterized protein n=1 Tax=Leishmania martiniquensis TaxID=1580590 RepID=A0A836HRH5_9TRYP|nr:hypothetical protein LSCM1_05624 [Leishmania martiniquensis]
MRGRQRGATKRDAGALQRREDVFFRLSRWSPASLSSSAFEAVAAHLQEEEAQCTFLPRVNHTHDAALMHWAAGSNVFTRLYGHAKCLQQQCEEAAEAKRKADAAEIDEWHATFPQMPFPRHLCTRPRVIEDHVVDSATAGAAPPAFHPTASTPKRRTWIVSALHAERQSAHAAATDRSTRSEDSRPSVVSQESTVLSVARANVWLSRMRIAHRSRAHTRNVGNGTASAP